MDSLAFRSVDRSAYEQAKSAHAQAWKRLSALGKTCTTTELETAVAALRRAEATLKQVLACEA
jgi:hypothetical protein